MASRSRRSAPYRTTKYRCPPYTPTDVCSTPPDETALGDLISDPRLMIGKRMSVQSKICPYPSRRLLCQTPDEKLCCEQSWEQKTGRKSGGQPSFEKLLAKYTDPTRTKSYAALSPPSATSNWSGSINPTFPPAFAPLPAFAPPLPPLPLPPNPTLPTEEKVRAPLPYTTEALVGPLARENRPYESQNDFSLALAASLQSANYEEKMRADLSNYDRAISESLRVKALEDMARQEEEDQETARAIQLSRAASANRDIQQDVRQDVPITVPVTMTAAERRKAIQNSWSKFSK